MNGIDVWDGVLLAFGAYVAVTALVRLMAGKRTELTDRLRGEIRVEQQRKRAEEKKRKKKEARAAQQGGRAA